MNYEASIFFQKKIGEGSEDKIGKKDDSFSKGGLIFDDFAP
jgi:hypothetical protein